MKKNDSKSKKLGVAVETVRELTTKDSLVVAGGLRPQSTRPDRTC
jgi:hypothetical protein